MNPIRYGGHTRRHRHTTPVTHTLMADGTMESKYACGHPYDEAKARRGRLAAKRGKQLQRQRITALGGRNLPGNAENLDGLGELFAYEHKSGSVYPRTLDRYLRGIPVQGQQIRVLIVTETPGSGRKARAVVVVDYDDWRNLHQETEELG
jgi:hypothetical protein